jgi:hypothetical protein
MAGVSAAMGRVGEANAIGCNALGRRPVRSRCFRIIADGAGASTLGEDRLISHGLAAGVTAARWLTMRDTELV